jgi:hypothetical protein
MKNITKELEPEKPLLINRVIGQCIISILSGMTYKRTKPTSGALKKNAGLQQQAFYANPAANTSPIIQIAFARCRASVSNPFTTKSKDQPDETLVKWLIKVKTEISKQASELLEDNRRQLEISVDLKPYYEV